MQQGLSHELHDNASRLATTALTVFGTHAVAWSAAGVLSLGLAAPMGLIGCAAAPSRTQASGAAAIEPVSAELPPPNQRLSARSPQRVVFSDEPDSDFTEPPTDAQSLAQGMPDAGSQSARPSGEESGLIEALAGSYENDMKALTAMQADRKRGGAPAFNDAPVEAEPPKSNPGPTDEGGDTDKADGTGAAAVKTGRVMPSTPEAGEATTEQPTAVSVGPIASATVPTVTSPSAATSPTATTPAAPATPVTPAVPSKDSLANVSLELPPALIAAPTEPAELTRLLAESLAKRGASSTEPTRDWLAYAALAIGEPSLSLPQDFGSDLLPAERERIEKVHSAFAAVGRLLAQGGEIDQATAEGLVAALTGGPKLEIPKVEFCTKVESFGRFAPLGNDRFLARSNARFILYTELAGFSSELVDGEFVTRLATRVSIESERDGIEVWARQPAWTAVVDHSPTRREDFFVGEIVSVSEYLSVGSYRLKVEIRDEASGRLATAYHPLHIVADPSMAAVGD